MSFSDKLKQSRIEKHMTQEGLAEMLNVSRQAVSKWEQGIGYPEIDKLIVLKNILNVSLDWLFEDELSDKKDGSDQLPIPTGILAGLRSFSSAISNVLKLSTLEKDEENDSRHIE